LYKKQKPITGGRRGEGGGGNSVSIFLFKGGKRGGRETLLQGVVTYLGEKKKKKIGKGGEREICDN